MQFHSDSVDERERFIGSRKDDFVFRSLAINLYKRPIRVANDGVKSLTGNGNTRLLALLVANVPIVVERVISSTCRVQVKSNICRLFPHALIVYFGGQTVQPKILLEYREILGIRCIGNHSGSMRSAQAGEISFVSADVENRRRDVSIRKSDAVLVQSENLVKSDVIVL